MKGVSAASFAAELRGNESLSKVKKKSGGEQVKAGVKTGKGKGW